MAKPTGLVLLAAVLAGCSTLTGGRAVPADADGPRPVTASILHRVLLDPATLNDIMGESAMTVKDTGTQLLDDSAQFPDRACMIAWTPAEQTVYADTGWTAVITQTLSEIPGRSEHFVIQAVVSFGSRAQSAAFFQHAARQWTECGERTFKVNRGRAETSWTFGPVATADSALWMTQRQDRGAGWSCQRGLRVSNNVAIDVLACKFYASDEAMTIVGGIDARLPSV